ncbi:hypothetical protein V491_08531, partial [Pseudogymnoascus sp. VKM F-3775]
VKLTPGPGYVVKGAAAAADSSSSTVVVPTLSHSAGSTVSASATAAIGGVFNENNAKVADVEVATPTPSTTAAPSLSLAANQKVSKTSYITQGGSVVEVIVIEELTTVTDEPQTKTVTAAANARRHAHRHARHI